MTKNKEWLVVLGAALLAAGFYLLAFAARMPLAGDTTVNQTVGTALVVAGVIVLLRAKRGKILVDERVVSSSNKAYAYAWYASFLFVAALIWANIFWPGSLTVDGALGLLLFFVSGSGIAFKYWFDKHPEEV